MVKVGFFYKGLITANFKARGTKTVSREKLAMSNMDMLAEQLGGDGV